MCSCLGSPEPCPLSSGLRERQHVKAAPISVGSLSPKLNLGHCMFSPFIRRNNFQLFYCFTSHENQLGHGFPGYRHMVQKVEPTGREARLKDDVWVRIKQRRRDKLCSVHLKAPALYTMTRWAHFEKIRLHDRKDLEEGI